MAVVFVSRYNELDKLFDAVEEETNELVEIPIFTELKEDYVNAVAFFVLFFKILFYDWFGTWIVTMYHVIALISLPFILAYKFISNKLKNGNGSRFTNQFRNFGKWFKKVFKFRKQR
jgi:hypothetical protein